MYLGISKGPIKCLSSFFLRSVLWCGLLQDLHGRGYVVTVLVLVRNKSLSEVLRGARLLMKEVPLKAYP